MSKGTVAVLIAILLLAGVGYYVMSERNETTVVIGNETHTVHFVTTRGESFVATTAAITNNGYITRIETITATLPELKSIDINKFDVLILYPEDPGKGIVFDYHIEQSDNTVYSCLYSLNLNWGIRDGITNSNGPFENVNEHATLVAPGTIAYQNYFTNPPIMTTYTGNQYLSFQSKYRAVLSSLASNLRWGIDPTITISDGVYVVMQPPLKEFDTMVSSKNTLDMTGVAALIVKKPVLVPESSYTLVLPTGTYYGYFTLSGKAGWGALRTYTITRTVVKDLPR